MGGFGFDFGGTVEVSQNGRFRLRFLFFTFGFPFSQLSSRLSFELGHEFGIAFSELNDFFFVSSFWKKVYSPEFISIFDPLFSQQFQ